MTASALLRHGPEHVATMREGLERWLGANGFDSVDAIRGLKDATHVEHVDALFRAQYVAALTEYLPGKLVPAGTDWDDLPRDRERRRRDHHPGCPLSRSDGADEQSLNEECEYDELVDRTMTQAGRDRRAMVQP